MRQWAGDAATGFDRLFALAGTDPADVARGKVLAFRRWMLLIVACDLWYVGVIAAPSGVDARVLAVLASLLCVVGFAPRYGRLAAGAAAALVATLLVSIFPIGANHHYVELCCLLLLASFDSDREDEAALLLQSLRWLFAIGFFWSGLQKVLYGYYFGGEFLAYRIALDERFAQAFGLLVPSSEMVRLRELVFQPWAGPYRIESFWFVVASNLTWIAELVLPPLLIVRATRRFALAATLAFLIAIELGARELLFGGTMVGLALLYAERDWLSRLLPILAVGVAVLLAMIAGALPWWAFS